MSQENVGVVRRHQEAFNRGDLMTMLEYRDRSEALKAVGLEE